MAAAAEPPLPLTPARIDGEALLRGGSDSDAGAELRREVESRGFAILRLSTGSAATLGAAAAAAGRFFRLPPTQKEATRTLFDEAHVGAKGLVGFNVVTPSKSVFRIRRQHPAPEWRSPEDEQPPGAKRRRTTTAEEEEEEDGGASAWPPEQVLPGFRRDVEEAWALLEQVISRCSASLLGDEVHSAWEAEHLKAPTSTAGSQQEQQPRWSA